MRVAFSRAGFKTTKTTLKTPGITRPRFKISQRYIIDAYLINVSSVRYNNNNNNSRQQNHIASYVGSPTKSCIVSYVGSFDRDGSQGLRVLRDNDKARVFKDLASPNAQKQGSHNSIKK